MPGIDRVTHVVARDPDVALGNLGSALNQEAQAAARHQEKLMYSALLPRKIGDSP